MSYFEPDSHEALAGEKSYNCGIPDARQFCPPVGSHGRLLAGTYICACENSGGSWEWRLGTFNPQYPGGPGSKVTVFRIAWAT